MIGRIIGSGRRIADMVVYITHDQTSTDNRRPTGPWAMLEPFMNDAREQREAERRGR